MDTTDGDALDRADMQRLAAGEDRALDALMERHARRVFNFLNRLLSNPADAEDLAQETFARLYRARARFNPCQRFSAWLYTIAANLARNHVRWRTRHPEVALEVDHDSATALSQPHRTSAARTPAEQLDDAERAATVRAAVQRLPEVLREVIVLCEWEELSVPEAAAILGTTPKAVESKLYRARERLRESLRDRV